MHIYTDAVQLFLFCDALPNETFSSITYLYSLYSWELFLSYQIDSFKIHLLWCVVNKILYTSLNNLVEPSTYFPLPCIEVYTFQCFLVFCHSSIAYTVKSRRQIRLFMYSTAWSDRYQRSAAGDRVTLDSAWREERLSTPPLAGVNCVWLVTCYQDVVENRNIFNTSIIACNLS